MSKNLNEKLSPINRALMYLLSSIPYGVGTRGLAWLYRTRWVRLLLFKRRLNLVRHIMTLSTTPQNENETMVRHLTCNILMPWRVVALSRLDKKELGKWVEFKNEENLNTFYGKDKGIVLVNSHIGAGRIIALMLLRKGYKITAMDPEPYLAKIGAKDADKMNVISLRGGSGFWLKEVFKAKKVLESREILTLVADGRAGIGGIQHTFHDVTIPFHISFAELAIQTNSIVIPVFAKMDSLGKTVIEFLPPFDTGDTLASREDRVRLLLDQYVTCLEKEWRDNPGNVLSNHVHLYIRAKKASVVAE